MSTNPSYKEMLELLKAIKAGRKKRNNLTPEEKEVLEAITKEWGTPVELESANLKRLPYPI